MHWYATPRPRWSPGCPGLAATSGWPSRLVDDLLGIWGEPARTGKPVGSDLRSRKKSVPVVRAASSDSPAGRAFAELYRTERPLTDDELALAARLIEAAGARDWTRRRALRETAAAVTELNALALHDDVHHELADLATFTTGRDH